MVGVVASFDMVAPRAEIARDGPRRARSGDSRELDLDAESLFSYVHARSPFRSVFLRAGQTFPLVREPWSSMCAGTTSCTQGHEQGLRHHLQHTGTVPGKDRGRSRTQDARDVCVCRPFAARRQARFSEPKTAEPLPLRSIEEGEGARCTMKGRVGSTP